MIRIAQGGRAAAEAAVRGAASLARSPLASAAACAAVAVAFALLALTAVAARNLTAVTGSWSAGAGMIVYLAEGEGEARARRIAAALDQLPGVERVTWVPPEQGVERLRAMFAADPAVARDLEPGLVPAALEVELAPGTLEAARAHPLVDALERTPGVDEVVFAGDWLARVEALAGGLERAGFWIALLVAVACAWVLSVTIRLRIAGAGRGEEARTWDLVGASSWLVRGPRMVEGGLLGAAGAAAGVALAFALFDLAEPPVAAALAAAFGPADLEFLPAGAIARLVAFGGALGLCAGLIGRRERVVHAVA